MLQLPWLYIVQSVQEHWGNRENIIKQFKLYKYIYVQFNIEPMKKKIYQGTSQTKMYYNSLYIYLLLSWLLI